MATFFLSLALIAFAMLIMAVGVLFKRPCLRGSCGGPTIFDGNGEPLTCATCPNRNKGGDGADARRSALPLVDS